MIKSVLSLLSIVAFFCLVMAPNGKAQHALSSLDITGGINFEFGYDWNGSSYVSISIAAGVSKNFYNEYRQLSASEKSVCQDQINSTPCEFDFDNLMGYQKFFKQHTSPSYQAALNIYFNSIGDNILDDFKKVNIDFVHSMMFSLGKNVDSTSIDQYEVVIRPFNTQTASVVKDNMSNSVTVGTNFILNNSYRNQRIGFANINIARFLVAHYYNDGPPYTRFSSDGYDRWWTGGGTVDLYFNQLFKNQLNFFTNSRVSVSYDRFTGNVQNAFLASEVFGFYYVPTKDLKQNFL